MKTIFKYPLEVTDLQTVQIHSGWEPLTVQVQNGQPCLWAIVNPAEPLVRFRIACFGTGHAHPEDLLLLKHLGSVQLRGGQLIFHYFLAS